MQEQDDKIGGLLRVLRFLLESSAMETSKIQESDPNEISK